MAPKSTFTHSMKQNKKAKNVFEEEEILENDEEEESDCESKVQSDDDDDDFLDAVTEASSKKRKLESDGEEDEDASENGEESTENTKVTQKKKKKKKKVSTADMKPPTAEEMIRLRETENLFHSNLFRMQIEEMLKEVKPKKVERKQIKPWLEKIKDFLMKVDDSDKIKLDTECLLDVKSPLPKMPKEEDRPVTHFLRPVSASVVGSYNSGCCLGPSLSVDITVEMPKKCFLKEDYLNARYHLKRAVYLGHLARLLQTSELVCKQQGVSWSLLGGNPLCPRLLLHPAVDKLNKVNIYISAVPQGNTFKLSRFTPCKNNIRESWLTKGKKKDCQTASSVYNASVVGDLVLTSNDAVQAQVLENNNNLKDGVLLLRVWLRQRQLDTGLGGFSGHLVSMLVTSMLMSRKLNSLMSSYQVVRNVWLLLSQSDWTKEGYTMSSTKKEETAPKLQEFHEHFDVVFVDATGYCNLAASVNRLTYLRIRQEAKLAVDCLDNPNMNSFQALFMTPMPFLRQFDHVLCIQKNWNVVQSVLKKETSKEERMKHFATPDMLVAVAVGRLLERGVGGRLAHLEFQLPPLPQWGVGVEAPLSDLTLVVGLRLNPETAYSIVEKGPPANEPQAAKFRALWGDRCELRRFRDGTVCETVVWRDPDAPLSSRRLVTRDMVTYLLMSRLQLRSQDITYQADQLETLVTEKQFVPESFHCGAGEEACAAVVRAWDALAKQLRELPELPLDVASVQGIAAALRATDVFPPLPGHHKPQSLTGVEAAECFLLSDTFRQPPHYVAPIEGVVQLGLSRQWPEDIEAIRRIKAAFYIQIAKTMLEKYDVQTQAFSDYVHIFKEGFVFRVRIVYPREVSLLKATTTPDGKLCYRDTPESLALERDYLHLPKLTGALHGLQQQFPAYSVACRLAKRWLCCQLLDASHVPEVVVELLVASLFLSPEPFRTLTQPQPMFLRFLHLLAHTNWHLEPVIVNFNGDLKREDLVEIESVFRSDRSSLPPLFIATQYDRGGSVFTRDAPSLPVLARTADLARQALSVLETQLLQHTAEEEYKMAFRPPLELYDALIRLKPLQCPRMVHSLDYNVKEPVTLKVPKVRKKIPVVGFDPPQLYLQELRESYSDYALFFHDTYGGSMIGVLFKPSAFEKHEFKVSQVNCRKPVKEDKKQLLALNFDAIIEDFYIIGKGLVKSIELSHKYSR
ncbi:nucleolar protein 6-like [Macrosteles quadrilineatus]|uniref:nucleolar protein 6-like n=1 Tax=Macrosteles quadrilineatus TaxID=74068 RepID=UPI0023E16455|nr:nucleolar protein 6-like [Macrosteles quadrilineatus]